MAQDVFVRFVPKARRAVSRMASFEKLAPETAGAYQPDAARADGAQLKLQELNIPSIRTPEQRLESVLPRARFEEVFKVPLIQATSSFDPGGAGGAPTKAKRESFTKHETFLRPAGEVPVPDDLKDTIEFAYVPRPVEYHLSFVPPMEDNYHLRLEDVVQAVNAARCHRKGWRGNGIRVAMADSGFAKHPFFDRGGYNIVRLTGPGANNPEKDTSGHGTGESANILAIAPDVTLICVKQGSSAAGDLETALAQNPHVMTHSWGFDIDSRSKEALKQQDPNMFNEVLDIETILIDAVSRGVVICFSGGNGHLAFPASIPDLIAVGGVTVLQDGSLEASSYASSFVSRLYPNRKVPDLCGIVGSATRSAQNVLPGHIMLPVPPGSELDGSNFAPAQNGTGWGIFSGTSAASPQMAGVIALMLSANPNLTPKQVRQILQGSAIDVSAGETAMGDKATAGADLATGAGFVDAWRACNTAAGIS